MRFYIFTFSAKVLTVLVILYEISVFMFLFMAFLTGLKWVRLSCKKAMSCISMHQYESETQSDDSYMVVCFLCSQATDIKI